MYRMILTLAACATLASQVFSQTQAPAPAAQAPQIETRKIEGTDNVYTFRNQNSQSMFIVTSEGVIATDPVGYGRPQGGDQYLAEIRKITNQPIRYVIYSHHHFDHIAGGRAFKTAGARFVAHRRAKERLEVLKDPNTVLPDETIDRRHTITLGGTTVELNYVGLNHSDSTLVMRLPRERILFVVDLLPVGQVPGRGMIDFHPLEAEGSIKQILAMDWERLVPGHPGAGGRLGTKQDAQDQLTFLQDASAAVRAEAQQGRCWDPVESTLKLPKYASWPNYEANLQFVLRRYCLLWGRGT
jgi:glyoxylase-like metal-dependent hydrolase (beta-lactamase superfamily II)